MYHQNTCNAHMLLWSSRNKKNLILKILTDFYCAVFSFNLLRFFPNLTVWMLILNSAAWLRVPVVCEQLAQLFWDVSVGQQAGEPCNPTEKWWLEAQVWGCPGAVDADYSQWSRLCFSPVLRINEPEIPGVQPLWFPTWSLAQCPGSVTEPSRANWGNARSPQHK